VGTGDRHRLTLTGRDVPSSCKARGASEKFPSWIQGSLNQPFESSRDERQSPRGRETQCPMRTPKPTGTRAHRGYTMQLLAWLDPMCVASMAPFPFPLGNFTCYFTLSPECFSPFLHSTCLLSVSVQYLALDGVYHPFGAAISSNPTLGTERRGRNGWTMIVYGAVTLFGATRINHAYRYALQLS